MAYKGSLQKFRIYTETSGIPSYKMDLFQRMKHSNYYYTWFQPNKYGHKIFLN